MQQILFKFWICPTYTDITINSTQKTLDVLLIFMIFFPAYTFIWSTYFFGTLE